MDSSTKSASDLHQKVPPDWYYRSIKDNFGQRYWHKTRFREVGKLIRPIKGKVLDIGCADGVFTKIILGRTNAKKITGIDVLESSINWARNHWRKNKRLSFEAGNAHDLKYQSGIFDAVFALEVLEHVSNPVRVLKEIKRVLSGNGYTVILVPTDSLLFRMIWFAWKKFGRGSIWNNCHVQSFSSNNTLADNLRKLGFVVEVDKRFLLGMLNVVRARKG